jgi:hypothetical protein
MPTTLLLTPDCSCCTIFGHGELEQLFLLYQILGINPRVVSNYNNGRKFGHSRVEEQRSEYIVMQCCFWSSDSNCKMYFNNTL